MSAGWLYYHKYPPKRKCSKCGKRHYLKKVGVFSNGEDVWRLICIRDKVDTGKFVTPLYEN